MIRRIVACGFASLLLGAGAAQANYVQNGGFESTTAGPNAFLGLGISDPVGWTYSPGVAAIYGPGAADTGGANQGGGGYIGLWGPNNGSANGLPATSPDGGNFLAGDADSAASNVSNPLSQLVNGLTPGSSYILTFDYGAAEFRNATGTLWNSPNQSQWQVSFGGQTQTTTLLSIGGEGFSGWKQASFLFTPTTPSALLSFLAVGGPTGVPPVALLDGISLEDVPEPDSGWLLGAGVLTLLTAGLRWRRRASQA